ncbi:MAG: membrane protein insertase YidC, partial [Kiloniellales bacterium]
MLDQRNLILAIVLSLAILLGFQFFFVEPQMQQELAQQQAAEQQAAGQPVTGQTTSATPPTSESLGAPTPPGTPGEGALPVSPEIARTDVLAQAPRIEIETPTLRGSISLAGGRIDDLILTQYRETLDENSDQIVLLSPPGAANPYFVDYGWTTTARDLRVPNAESVWRTNDNVLFPGRPVRLTWDNGQGLRFERIYEIDENYLFTVTQRVANNGTATVTLSPYGLISRTGTPDILGFYILHEGPLGVFDGTLDEVDYSDLQDDGLVQTDTTGGWIGITDKYWLVALVPDQDKPVSTRFLHDAKSGVDKYQADYLYQDVTIQPGRTAESTSRLFAGAKVVKVLDDYRDNLGIVNFDLSVDFGWFYFLTKPLFYALSYLTQMVGNFGVGILILTVGIKLVFFPLANKSYGAMAKMRKLQPEMLKLRERFGDDKQRLNQEMMALYKKEGTNPASGCLPIVVQIPVFFALYKVMFVTIEMRHAPFFGWIQ